ncbi:YXWGXW repeat-containing protein [Pseudomonas chlororaphis subsp. piscium]
MLLRYTALVAVVVVASGCVQERVVHERRVVERAAPVRVIEVGPMHRPGYVWSRAYWHWDGRQYVAVHGHWEPLRPGYHYVHPFWERRGDGWHLHAGGWAS